MSDDRTMFAVLLVLRVLVAGHRQGLLRHVRANAAGRSVDDGNLISIALGHDKGDLLDCLILIKRNSGLHATSDSRRIGTFR